MNYYCLNALKSRMTVLLEKQNGYKNCQSREQTRSRIGTCDVERLTSNVPGQGKGVALPSAVRGDAKLCALLTFGRTPPKYSIVAYAIPTTRGACIAKVPSRPSVPVPAPGVPAGAVVAHESATPSLPNQVMTRRPKCARIRAAAVANRYNAKMKREKRPVKLK